MANFRDMIDVTGVYLPNSRGGYDSRISPAKFITGAELDEAIFEIDNRIERASEIRAALEELRRPA